MTVTGPVYASIVDNAIGAWGTIANAQGSTSNNTADISISTPNFVATLDLRGYNLSSIPAGSIINSVTVIVRGQKYSSSDLFPQAQMYDGATAIGATQTLSTLNSASLVNESWSPSTLPTAAQLKSSTFKVQFRARHDGSSNPGNTMLDWISVDVTYSNPSIPVAYTATVATSTSTMVDPIVNPNFGRINFPAPVATLSAAMPDAVITAQRPNTYVASAATLSAVMTNALYVTRVTSIVSADRASTTPFQQDSVTINDEAIYLKAPSLVLPNGATILKAYLHYRGVSSGASIFMNVYRITSDWSEATTNVVTLDTVNMGPASDSAAWQDVDISIAVAAWRAGAPNYGIALQAISAGNIYSSESISPASIVIEYVVPDASIVVLAAPATEGHTMPSPVITIQVDTTYASTPAAESHLMVSPAISTTANVNYGATAATSTAVMVDPTIYAVHPFDFAAAAFTATADMLNGVFALPVTISAAAATESHLMTDTAVLAEDNAVISAAPFTGLSFLIAPVEAQSATADSYYNRVLATTDSDDYWYRLDELSGTTVADARHDILKTADLSGSYSLGTTFGPESRKAIHFDSGYLTPRLVDNNAAPSEFSFEVVLRTTDPDGLLTNSTGYRYGGSPVHQGIYLKDGKVTVTSTWNADPGGLGQAPANYAQHFNFSGIKNVADGQWHHIVVTYGDSPIYDGLGVRVGGSKEGANINVGLRIFIDGKLDRRKAVVERNLLPREWWIPDSYFGMANHAQRIIGSYSFVPARANTSGIITSDNWPHYAPVYEDYVWPKNFTGDVMEVVMRSGSGYIQSDFEKLYYDAFGIVPIKAGPASTGSGFMPSSIKAKGNKRKILILGPPGEVSERADVAPPENFNHVTPVRMPYSSEREEFDYNGMSIVARDYFIFSDAEMYRDPITDRPRLINLQTDVDMTDVDMIMFKSWSIGGVEAWEPHGIDHQAVDDFLASVKQAVVGGVAMEITSPVLAMRLGLITGATAVPTLYEKGGGYEKDAHSAAIDPWGGDSTTPSVPALMPSGGFAGPAPSDSGSFEASAPSEPYPGSVVEIIPQTDEQPEDMPLGRYINHDPRSWDYAYALDPTAYLTSKTHLRVIPIMNQQGFGACTGFAALGALGTAPLYATVSGETLDAALAMKIYSEATKIDPFPGTYPPDFTGSDGLSVAKVMKTMGLIAGYQHAFTIDDALAALQSGPVITGIGWYQGFNYPDKNGLVHIAGTKLGGHEVCVVGINVKTKTVTAANSWGPSWGKDGFFTFSWADWATLLGEGGDVTILNPRSIWGGRADISAENLYMDTHGNNFYRVVAEVEDLTDIPSAFLADNTIKWNQTMGADYEELTYWSYKLTDRPDGLVIGDTMMDPDRLISKSEVFSNNLSVTTGMVKWDRWMWAITPDGLPSGTPVYKFAETIWDGNTQVPNPYAEYIGGAVLRPGDTWGGVRIAGKIWINFAEQPGGHFHQGVLKRQIVPPNATLLAYGDSPETEAQRSWDYSYTRVTSTPVTTGTKYKDLVLDYGGMFSDKAPRYVFRKLGIRSAPSEFEKYPVDSVITLSWTLRGLAWLGVRNVVVDGDVTIRPTAIVSTGAPVNPTVVAEHGVTVIATPAQAVGVINDPVGVIHFDTIIYVFAAEASGYMTPYGKTITADPFIASGDIVDNFDMVNVEGEEVSLYLYNSSEISLYLKEDK